MASKRNLPARHVKLGREDQVYHNKGLGHSIPRLNDKPSYTDLINKLNSNHKLDYKEILKLRNLTGNLVNRAGDHAVFVWKGDLYNANDDAGGIDKDGFDTKNYEIFNRPLTRRPRGRNLHAETGCDVRKGVCALISQKLGKWIKKQSAQGLSKWEINDILKEIDGQLIYKSK